MESTDVGNCCFRLSGSAHSLSRPIKKAEFIVLNAKKYTNLNLSHLTSKINSDNGIRYMSVQGEPQKLSRSGITYEAGCSA